jgi:hypothetical protein
MLIALFPAVLVVLYLALGNAILYLNRKKATKGYWVLYNIAGIVILPCAVLYQKSVMPPWSQWDIWFSAHYPIKLRVFLLVLGGGIMVVAEVFYRKKPRG